MDIRQLRYFESVVRNKSLTKAAKELYISQPAMSIQIKALEQEFGGILFYRNTRKISVTELGQLLYRHACEILNQSRNIFKEMEDFKEIGSGELSIGVIESSTYMISKIILPFRDKYPDLFIKIKNMGAEEIDKALNNYDIHIGINSRKTESSNLTSIPLVHEEYVLITPPGHPLKHVDSIDMFELRNENIIQTEQGFYMKQIIQNACLTAGFELKGLYESGRLDTVRILVETGLGIAFVPETYLKYASTSQFNVVRLKNPTPKRTVYISYHSLRYLPTAIHEFMSQTLNYFRGVSAYTYLNKCKNHANIN